jgi:hypothetical protein
VGTHAPAGTGTAWVDGESGERALYRREGEALHSLLLADPPTADTWFGKSLALDGPDREVVFAARASGRPRRLSVRGPGGTLAEVSLATAWTPVRLPAAAGRVRLEVDGCDLGEGAAHRDVLCRGFQLQGLRPLRVELYDLVSDPAQRHDLARERTAPADRLLRELVTFTPAPRAKPGAGAPLDDEAAARLRALGYAAGEKGPSGRPRR